METIRNYLESMFANLPNTADVLKAKTELLQMMEDKYDELISEGKTVNEAIGIVISEFGNLDELAETLGIENIVRERVQFQGITLGRDQVSSYIEDSEKSILKKSIGVMLCIISPIVFIIAVIFIDRKGIVERVPLGIATAVFFCMLAAAIFIFVFTNIRMEKWKFIRKQPCEIDYAAAEYIHNLRESGRMSYAMLKTIGIILCVICFVSAAVMGAVGVSYTVMYACAALLFVFVGIGVMLLINANGRESTYMQLLRMNDRSKVSGNYVSSQEDEIYANETLTKVMSVYYQTVLCIYLCWSFLTFAWYITWIIWPVAAILRRIIRSIWGSRPAENL